MDMSGMDGSGFPTRKPDASRRPSDSTLIEWISVLEEQTSMLQARMAAVENSRGPGLFAHTVDLCRSLIARKWIHARPWIGKRALRCPSDFDHSHSG